MAERRINSVGNHLHPYVYTLPNTFLTKLQRDQYENDGFFIVKKLVSQTDLDRFMDIANGIVKPEPTMLVMKDISVVKNKHVIGERALAKIQDYQDDPILMSFARNKKILEYVKCITGPNIKSMHTMLINKPPNVGVSSTHPLHQDLHYFPFRPIDKIVCAWTAIDNVNLDNGCLVVIPGSHKGELLPHGYHEWEGKVNPMYHEVQGLDRKGSVVAALMAPGDTIFFHPLLIHGSGPNKTDGFRKAISCHYASSNCHYIDVKGTIQENIAKEVEEIAKKRYGNGSDIPFNFIWQIRSRLVAGEEGELC